MKMSNESISISLLQTLLGETDIHRTLDHIARHVDETIQNGAHGIIYLYDPVQNCLKQGSRPQLHFSPLDPHRENIYPVKATGSTSSRAAFYKKPVLTTDIDLDPGWSDLLHLARLLKIKSAYSIPILSTQNNLLGIFVVYYEHCLDSEPQEANLYRTLASLAAVALEKHQNQLQNRQTLTELTTSKERLNLALESQKMGVWDWWMGPPNRLHWDENMFQVFGMDPKDFDGTFESFAKCVHPEDIGTVEKLLSDVFTKNFPYDMQFRILRHGEVRHIAAIGKLNRDVSGNPIRMTGLNWDVTDKVLATQKVDQERARAILNSKMASLGEMASGIAHEVNNPLTIILNRTGMLKDKLLSDQFDKSQAIEELTRIETTVERIAKIVRGLRSISRNSEKDPLLPYELNSIVDESLALCRERFHSHGISLSVQGSDQPLHIQCRPSQISQVLLNIFNNSFDAILGTEKSWIEIEFALIAKKVQIRITDSGKGICDTIAEKIMDPFFTTKEVGKGTGLGLSISKNIVEEHGGRLFLDRSHPHTRFVIELPFENQSDLL